MLSNSGKLIFIIIALLSLGFLFYKTGSVKPPYTYYEEKVALFNSLEAATHDVVFIGDSLTDNCEWHELFPNIKIANRGIQGDTAEGVYQRVDHATKTHASIVFLMIGINDLIRGHAVSNTAASIEKTVTHLSQHHDHIYLQSTLYTNNQHGNVNQKVTNLNNTLKDIALQANVTFVDLNQHLAPKQQLRKEYTLDGIHLNGLGYLAWKNAISPFIDQPS